MSALVWEPIAARPYIRRREQRGEHWMLFLIFSAPRCPADVMINTDLKAGPGVSRANEEGAHWFWQE